MNHIDDIELLYAFCETENLPMSHVNRETA